MHSIERSGCGGGPMKADDDGIYGQRVGAAHQES